MEPVEVFKFSDGCQLEVYPDECPESPRTWDNIGVMVCFHKHYDLGDKHDYRTQDYDGWQGLHDAILADHPTATILPLFLYDHSGLAISTGRKYSFNCPWDSGQVGFIYAEPEDGADVLKCLEAEVNVYNQYLQGDVYGFILRGPPCDKCDGPGEDQESCWGFYGSNPLENGMSDNLSETHRAELKKA